MNKNVWHREADILRFELKEHFATYKKWYVVFGILLLIGLVAGIIVGISMRTNLTITKVPEKTFVNFVTGKSSIVGLFFSRLGSVVLLCVAIWLSCIRPWIGALGIALIVYRSFMLGVTSAMLVLLYNISGAINVLLIVIPCYMSLLCVLASFAIITMRYSASTKVYGGSVLSRDFWCIHKKPFIFLGMVILFTIVLELILLPLLSSTLLVINS